MTIVDIHPTISVEMRDNTSGETRIIPMNLPWHKSSHFCWTEGNFRCDCNRYAIFMRDKGIDIEDEDWECGDTRFSVIRAIFPDGSEELID